MSLLGLRSGWPRWLGGLGLGVGLVGVGAVLVYLTMQMWAAEGPGDSSEEPGVLSEPADQELIEVLGRVLTGRTMQHIFTLKNPHSETYHLDAEKRIVRDCGCARLEVTPQVLRPGEQAQVRVQVRVTREGMFRHGGKLTWVSATGQPWEVVVALQGEAVPPVRVSPEIVLFSETDIIEGKIQEVLILPTEAEIAWEEMQCWASPPFEVVALEPWERAKGPAGRRVRLRCVLPETPSYEVFGGTLTVRGRGWDRKEKEPLEFAVAVPLQGRWQQGIKVLPEVLLWSPAGKGPQPPAKLLLQGSRLQPQEIVQVWYGKRKVRWQAQALGEGTVLVQVWLPELLRPASGERLRIEWDQGRSLTVPVVVQEKLPEVGRK